MLQIRILYVVGGFMVWSRSNSLGSVVQPNPAVHSDNATTLQMEDRKDSQGVASYSDLVRAL